jgi:hypothetical protein
MKICSKCGGEKPLDEFYNYQQSKDGKRSACKECTNKDNKSWAQKNEVSYTTYLKKYRQAHKEEHAEYLSKYNDKHKDRIKIKEKEWREKNTDHIKEKQKNWYDKNRRKKLRQNSEYRVSRMKNDPVFRLTMYLRSRMNGLMRGYKDKKALELLGCTLVEYKTYLESRFYGVINWENYGTIWHLDHIIPCSAFDLRNPEEQNKCFHYTNTQPLLAKENLQKYNKINK